MGIKKADHDKIFQKFERLDQEQMTIQGTEQNFVINHRLKTGCFCIANYSQWIK